MASKITNSATNKGKGKASLDHWYGPAQHTADGSSTDPAQEAPKAGPIRGPRYKEKAGAIVAALLLSAGVAWADGVIVKKSTCTVSWVAPQTNADGTELTDLAGYGIYIGTTPTNVTLLQNIAAEGPNPIFGLVVTWPCGQLTLGQHYVQVDAIDLIGQRSVRSALVPFVLEADVVDGPPSAPSNVQVK